MAKFAEGARTKKPLGAISSDGRFHRVFCLGDWRGA